MGRDSIMLSNFAFTTLMCAHTHKLACDGDKKAT